MSNKAYTDFAASSSPKATMSPQAEAIPGREAEMMANNSGGFTFVLDQWGVLDRFIMIGSEGGNYYVGERDITEQSFDTVKACLKTDGLRVVERVLEYSLSGRAPKNDPAVVVLALAAVYGNAETQLAAYQALPKVARTGTWLFLFVSILNSLGKWNAAAKRGVAKWYTSKEMNRLTLQLLKYQSRNGWSHRDVLRLTHVKPSSQVQSNLFKYVVKGAEGTFQDTQVPQLLIDFEMLKRTDNKSEVLSIIAGNNDLSWEMVPTQWHKDKDVMMALLQNMGLTAVIRKLGVLTARGVIDSLSDGMKLVVSKLNDAEALKAQRVHPITLLQAMKQYSQGHGEKGSLVWTPNTHVIDSLDNAFYASFDNVKPSNENYFVGVDISGSMRSSRVNGSPNLRASDVAAVMALVIAKTEPWTFIGGFNTKIKPLDISPKMRLDQVLKTMENWDGGGTNCSAAFEYALNNRMPVNKFVIITDNETNAYRKPEQVLNRYRKETGIGAKSVVIGTSVSQFTIADPKDSRCLDIAGFDSSAAQLIAEL